MQPMSCRSAAAPLALRVALRAALRVALLGSLLGGLLSACAWSVPADPGENARGRGALLAPDSASLPSAAAQASLPAEADPAAGALYASRCAQCHEPVHPATYSAAEWPAYVDRYGPRAGLFGSQRVRVLAWLQAHAGS